MNWKFLFALIFILPLILHSLYFVLLKCEISYIRMATICSTYQLWIKDDLFDLICVSILLSIIALLNQSRMKKFLSSFKMDAVLLTYYFIFVERPYFRAFIYFYFK